MKTISWTYYLRLSFSLLISGVVSASVGGAEVVAWGFNHKLQTNVPSGLDSVVALAAGHGHSMALRSNGTVVTWGSSPYNSIVAPAGLSNVVSIAAGSSHCLALRSDGVVRAWGAGSKTGSFPHYGQSIVPLDLTNAVSIAGGEWHSLAVRSDGTVTAWGYSASGQTNVPFGLSSVIAAAAGWSHSLALRSDGTVVAWGGGMNISGQVNFPAGLSNVVALSANGNHSLALRTDGTVVGWGSNGKGESTPPDDLSNVVAVAAGIYHSLALKADGSLVVWGANEQGQTNMPSGLGNLVAIAAGAYHCLAATGSGQPVIVQQPMSGVAGSGETAVLKGMAIGLSAPRYQWRFNGASLVDGDRLSGSRSPTLVLSGVQNSDAGAYSFVVSNEFGLAISDEAHLAVVPGFGDALDTTNLVWVSGGNARWSPQTNHSHTGVSAMETGKLLNLQSNWLQTTVHGPGVLRFFWKVSSEQGYDFLRFISNGVSVGAISGEVSWQERNYYLGVGRHDLRWVYEKDEWLSIGSDAGWLDGVVFIPGESKPVILEQPRSRSVALHQSVGLSILAQGPGSLTYQWYRAGSPLPGATQSILTIPSFEAADAGPFQAAVANAIGVATSAEATLTLSPIFAWGDNSFGQTNPPAGLDAVLAVAGGQDFSLALRADGTVACWGGRGLGETNTPPGLSNVIAIAAGTSHSLALRSDGTAVGWGKGATGTGTDLDFGQARVPASLSNLVAVAAGGAHSLVLRSDGTVVAWGLNDHGQTNVPAGLSNVVSIAAGSLHSLALLTDGSVVVWGMAEAPSISGTIVGISAGASHSLALLADGTIAPWGGNVFGQSSPPPGLASVVALASGGGGANHSLVLLANGEVKAWGDNGSGQVDIPGELASAVAVAAGYSHSLALLGDASLNVHSSAENPVLDEVGFTLQIPTQSGRVYALEFQDRLGSTNWTSLPLVPGTGTRQILVDRTTLPSQRFYRIRRW